MKLIKRIGLFASLVLATIQVSTAQSNKKPLDGVIAVLGEHIILESDIDKVYLEAKANDADMSDVPRCQILGSMLENKMFAHHAVQDSIVVTDAEITEIVDGQIDRMVEQAGSLENVLNFYKRKSVDDLKTSLSTIIKDNRLASAKQQEIIESVNVTPEEVRLFFNSFEADKLPLIPEMYELSEIVIKPKITKDEKDKVIEKLKEIRQEALDGYSFSMLVSRYSEDPGSLSTGGYYKMNKKTNFVKEFKDVAFSLKEGEISMPFETDFGYHIIYLEKISGADLELRHILMSVKPSEEAIATAKKEIEELRLRILNKEITFSDAARMYSNEKETRASGGLISYGFEGETRLPMQELSKDRQLFYAINGLKEGEVSQPYFTQSMNDRTAGYRIVELTKKIPEHKADFVLDYMEIKERALLDKQQKEIVKWINEKVHNTYIYISDAYKSCEFANNWLKK